MAVQSEPSNTNTSASLPAMTATIGARPQARLAARPLMAAASVAVVLFLVFYNLPNYPLTWFDEGSHLHVPKTLVLHGVYADFSSDGFRYYGPTVGVGPTVMLPIAAAFWAFGIGLLQARLVMALYLFAAIYAYFRLARLFGDTRFAWVATALLVTSPGVSLLEYGRQVLGEVPGFLFLVCALTLWLGSWERSSWRRLVSVGLLLALSVVTKSQYLLMIGPATGLAWLANAFYYRLVPARIFVVPGLIAFAGYGVWQLFTVIYLGPATALQNLALLRNATAGAALVFSPDLMNQAANFLLSFRVYFGLLLPILAFAVIRAGPHQREAQRWGFILLLVLVDLGWYVIASIGWTRYAFAGLALAGLFAARLFAELTDGFRFDAEAWWQAVRHGAGALPKTALAAIAWTGLSAMIVLPLAQMVSVIVSPPFNAPKEMAAYLTATVPANALVETWEPEMGFLAGNNFHYPPAALLNNAVAYIWLKGQPPSQLYDFLKPGAPEYVLVGSFGRWVGLFPDPELAAHYRLAKRIGEYDLYQLQSSVP